MASKKLDLNPTMVASYYYFMYTDAIYSCVHYTATNRSWPSMLNVLPTIGHPNQVMGIFYALIINVNKLSLMANATKFFISTNIVNNYYFYTLQVATDKSGTHALIKKHDSHASTR